MVKEKIWYCTELVAIGDGFHQLVHKYSKLLILDTIFSGGGPLKRCCLLVYVDGLV